MESKHAQEAGFRTRNRAVRCSKLPSKEVARQCRHVVKSGFRWSAKSEFGPSEFGRETGGGAGFARRRALVVDRIRMAMEFRSTMSRQRRNGASLPTASRVSESNAIWGVNNPRIWKGGEVDAEGCEDMIKSILALYTKPRGHLLIDTEGMEDDDAHYSMLRTTIMRLFHRKNRPASCCVVQCTPKTTPQDLVKAILNDDRASINAARRGAIQVPQPGAQLGRARTPRATLNLRMGSEASVNRSAVDAKDIDPPTVPRAQPAGFERRKGAGRFTFTQTGTSVFERNAGSMLGQPGLSSTDAVIDIGGVKGGTGRYALVGPRLSRTVVGGGGVESKSRRVAVGQARTCMIWIVRDIDLAPASTQFYLLQAMAQAVIPINGHKPLQLSQYHRVVATRAGASRVLLELLDHFFIEVEGKSFFTQLGSFYDNNIEDGKTASQLINNDFIEKIREDIKMVHVDPSLSSYARDVISTIRHHSSVDIGPSQRGRRDFEYLLRIYSRLISGKMFVRPDDIKDAAIKAIPHRVIPAANASMRELVHRLVNSKLEPPK